MVLSKWHRTTQHSAISCGLPRNRRLRHQKYVGLYSRGSGHQLLLHGGCGAARPSDLRVSNATMRQRRSHEYRIPVVLEWYRRHEPKLHGPRLVPCQHTRHRGRRHLPVHPSCPACHAPLRASSPYRGLRILRRRLRFIYWRRRRVFQLWWLHERLGRIRELAHPTINQHLHGPHECNEQLHNAPSARELSRR